MKRICLATAAILPLLCGSALAADPNLGRNLAATCANCHGTNGKTAGISTALVGVPKETLVQNFKAFRSGEKPATLMHQLSKGYSDSQIDAIASYFAAQK
jgi:cytochrome c553